MATRWAALFVILLFYIVCGVSFASPGVDTTCLTRKGEKRPVGGATTVFKDLIATAERTIIHRAQSTVKARPVTSTVTVSKSSISILVETQHGGTETVTSYTTVTRKTKSYVTSTKTRSRTVTSTTTSGTVYVSPSGYVNAPDTIPDSYVAPQGPAPNSNDRERSLEVNQRIDAQNLIKLRYDVEILCNRVTTEYKDVQVTKTEHAATTSPTTTISTTVTKKITSKSTSVINAKKKTTVTSTVKTTNTKTGTKTTITTYTQTNVAIYPASTSYAACGQDSFAFDYTTPSNEQYQLLGVQIYERVAAYSLGTSVGENDCCAACASSADCVAGVFTANFNTGVTNCTLLVDTSCNNSFFYDQEQQFQATFNSSLPASQQMTVTGAFNGNCGLFHSAQDLAFA